MASRIHMAESQSEAQNTDTTEVQNANTNTNDSSSTSVSDSTLDAITTVNSFLAVAAFVGLAIAFNQTFRYTSEKAGCSATVTDSNYVFRYEMFAFACFLFSTLVAHGLKLCLALGLRRHSGDGIKAIRINKRLLVSGLLLSAIGTVAGTVFFVFSLAYTSILKFGRLHCGNNWAEDTIIPVVCVTGAGVILFVSTILYELVHA